MDKFASKLGFWSAITIAFTVLLIDVGMILSAVLFPMTSITNIESYAASFSSWQMLPFIPSLILAPLFVVFMLSIHHFASQEKRILSQLGLSFALICAAILSLHYYIQLTVVQQGLLTGQTAGIWLLSTPNPNSFLWTFAALGYGFMGMALLSIAPIFKQKNIKLLLAANGAIGIAFLVGNALGIFAVDIFASFFWGTLFPVTALLIAKTFRTASTLQN